MGDIRLRMTKQRRMILEVLRNTYDHPSACEIYDTVRDVLPNISLGTVYRNLEILSSQGLVRKLELTSGQRRFDALTKNHSHIICISCGRIDDVPEEIGVGLESVQRRVGDATGFRDIEWSVGFHGLCPDCYAGSHGSHETKKTKKRT